MANIGDLVFGLIADATGLTPSVVSAAEKAGDAAGPAAGKSFGAKFGTAAKTAVGAIAGGLGGLLVGGILTGANALNQAATTAAAQTGQAVSDVTHQIAGLYQTNLQGFDQIGATLAKVHDDLGLTGDAATQAADGFLKLATATGTDAAGQVTNFDDILDAWNLTADKSQGIMDQLVASHQQYGGSIDANEQALAKLAPALQASNATLDDGIGLLNLFAATGLDASSASAALNHAVKELKPGQSLNDLVAQISSIEDPTLRAQEAVKIFGARGGVGLANALKPGVDSLSQFTITADDAAGATADAADKVNGSFGNQFVLLMHQAGGALSDFGTNFGPLVSAASLAGPGIVKALIGGLGGLAGALVGTTVAAEGEAAVAAGPAGSAVGAAIDAGIGLGMALLPVILVAAIVAAILFLVTHPEVVKSIADFAGSVISNVVSFLAGLPAALLGVFATAFGAVIGAVGPFVGSVAAAILGIPAAVVGWVAALIGQAAAAVAGFLSAIVGGAANVVATILSIPVRVAVWELQIVAQAVGLAAQVVGAIVGLAANIVGTILSIPGRIVGLVASVVGIFATLARDVLADIVGLVGSIVGALFALPGKLVALGGQIVSSIISGLASLPGKVLDAIAAAFRSIHIDIGPFHISAAGITIDLPHIDLPHFAAGGPIRGPAIVGEHGPELFVPTGPGTIIPAGDFSPAAPAPGGPGAGAGARSTLINVYNPKPEPASTSVKRQLQLLGAFGAGA